MIEGKVGAAYVEIIADLEKLATTLRRARSEIETFAEKSELTIRGRLTNAFQTVGRAVHSFQQRIFTVRNLLITGFAGYELQRLARSVLDTTDTFESYRMTLRAMLRDQALANEKWQQLLEFARLTPYTIGDVMRSFIMMRAYGIDPTIRMMTALGDAAAVIGKEALPRIAYALGQITAANKLRMQDLMQLQNAGINTMRALKEAFGTADLEELNKKLESGVIRIQQVIDAFVSYMEKQFGGTMQKRMDTLTGQIEILRSNWQEFLDTIGRSGVYKVAVDYLKQLNDWVDRIRRQGKLDEWARKVAEGTIHAIGSIAEKMGELVGWIETHEVIAEWGLLGWFVWGKKGLLAGAGVGKALSWLDELPDKLEETKIKMETKAAGFWDKLKHKLFGTPLRKEMEFRFTAPVEGLGPTPTLAPPKTEHIGDALTRLGERLKSFHAELQKQSQDTMGKVGVSALAAVGAVGGAVEDIGRLVSEALTGSLVDVDKVTNEHMNKILGRTKRFMQQITLLADKTAMDTGQGVADAMNATLVNVDEIMQDYVSRMGELVNKGKDVAGETADTIKRITQDISSGMEYALDDFFDYWSTRFLSFKDLAMNILHEIYMALVRTLIVRPIVNAAAGWITGAIEKISKREHGGYVAGPLTPVAAFAEGGVITGPLTPIAAFAEGGIIDRPTYLVGEGSLPEAVVPLPDGRSIPVKIVQAPSAEGAMQVEINIENKAQPVAAKVTSEHRVGKKYILNVVMEGLTTDPDFRSAIRGVK